MYGKMLILPISGEAYSEGFSQMRKSVVPEHSERGITVDLMRASLVIDAVFAFLQVFTELHPISSVVYMPWGILIFYRKHQGCK